MKWYSFEISTRTAPNIGPPTTHTKITDRYIDVRFEDPLGGISIPVRGNDAKDLADAFEDAAYYIRKLMKAGEGG